MVSCIFIALSTRLDTCCGCRPRIYCAAQRKRIAAAFRDTNHVDEHCSDYFGGSESEFRNMWCFGIEYIQVISGSRLHYYALLRWAQFPQWECICKLAAARISWHGFDVRSLQDATSIMTGFVALRIYILGLDDQEKEDWSGFRKIHMKN